MQCLCTSIHSLFAHRVPPPRHEETAPAAATDTKGEEEKEKEKGMSLAVGRSVGRQGTAEMVIYFGEMARFVPTPAPPL